MTEDQTPAMLVDGLHMMYGVPEKPGLQEYMLKLFRVWLIGDDRYWALVGAEGTLDDEQ